MGATNMIRALNPNQYDLLQYFGSVAQVAVTESKMEELGWSWVRQGNYAAHHEGPTFVWAGGNAKTRYNIRPWKKSNGTYVWRCHHPAFKTGDEFLEFLDPVSCAVAQEMMSDAIQDFRRTQ